MIFEDFYAPIRDGDMERCSSHVARYINKQNNKIVIAKKFQQKVDYEKELKINQMMDTSRIIQSFEEEKIIVFEDCGNDLFSLVQNQQINEKSLLMMFKNVLQCLIKMHEKNIFHGDIKLENIVTKDNHKAFLIDFGLSEVLEDNSATSDSGYGSTFYVAPETLKQKKHGLKADIYALGVSMFIALTGELPYEGNTIFEYQISQITSEPNLQHLQNANVSEKMIKIIAKMLDKNPEKRPTAEECYKLIYQPK